MSKCLLLFALFFSSGFALGQTACPEGVQPGDARCGPSPPWHTSVSVPQPRGPEWHLTWGAIAMDTDTGDVGTSVGKLSKREAKREAIARCAAAGSMGCKIQFAYHNQCAVIAGPSENGKSVGGTAFAQGGATIEIATRLALSSCTAKQGGGECAIEYSDCTVPALMN